MCISVEPLFCRNQQSHRAASTIKSLSQAQRLRAQENGIGLVQQIPPRVHENETME